MSSYSGAILYSYTAPWKQPAVFKSAFMGPFEGVRHHHKKSLTTIRAGLASYSKESYEGILQLPNRSDVSYRRIEGIIGPNVLELAPASLMFPEDAPIQDGGQEHVFFSDMGYMGLQGDARLAVGANSAILKYGTRVSSARVYVAPSVLNEAETAMDAVFGGIHKVILTANTSAAHQCVLPTMAWPGTDVIILDQQAHFSTQVAAQLFKADGGKVEIVRHNSMEHLEAKITKLIKTYNKVWYVCDGVYSQQGDAAPLAELGELLDKYPQLHLYVDDAHGMSWTGKYGCGYALSQIPYHERMIVATSLCKGFGAGTGGAIVLPNPELKRRLIMGVSPLMFSGGMGCGTMGEILASARIHMTAEFAALQQALSQRIAYMHASLLHKDIKVAVPDSTGPIFFVGLGSPNKSEKVVKDLYDAGFFTNLYTYPAVPAHASGLRFTVTVNTSEQQIDFFAAALASSIASNSSREELYSDVMPAVLTVAS